MAGAGMAGFTPDAIPLDNKAMLASLEGKVDVRVAEALADYCDKTVEVMQLCGKHFSKKADAAEIPVPARMQIATLYKLVLQARRAASEFYVFSHSQTDADFKSSVDAKRKEAAGRFAGQRAAVDAAIDAVLPTLPKDEAEGTAFLLKVRGDFYAFLARVHTGETRNELAETARHAYQKALSGPAEHTPIRLGAIFSKAVLEADICGDVKEALGLVQNLPPPTSELLSDKADCDKIVAILAQAEARWLAPTPTPDVAAAAAPPEADRKPCAPPS
mmetsp:Transcript_24311/g.72641  ORF Transcript_24311/g.72641 Transcript_24311/m.72641 type:complete len:274 (+) Transcript_24311:189-1010(+)